MFETADGTELTRSAWQALPPAGRPALLKTVGYVLTSTGRKLLEAARAERVVTEPRHRPAEASE